MPADRAQLSHHLRQDRAQKARGGNEVKERLAEDAAERRPHPSPGLALPRAFRLSISRDLLHRGRTLAVGVGPSCCWPGHVPASRWVGACADPTHASAVVEELGDVDLVVACYSRAKSAGGRPS